MQNKLSIYFKKEKTNEHTLEDLIFSAFIRSFGLSQINQIETCTQTKEGIHIFTECNSKNSYTNIKKILSGEKNKIILNGKLNESLKSLLEINNLYSDFLHEELIPANSYKPSFSIFKLNYQNKCPYLKGFLKCITQRPIWRYDFDLEWNNHCYGNILEKHEMLDLSHYCSFNEKKYIAYIENKNSEKVPLIAEFHLNNNLILWINRNLSVIDLPEWKIIEDFISSGYFSDFRCVPFLSEFSKNENGLITMRLDCDEDIESAKEVFEIYKDNNLPISLAITTNQMQNNEINYELPKNVIDYGGTILNHSHTHPTNWGNTKEEIIKEIKTSQKIIEKSFGIKNEFAVSPFHHLTWDALEILEEMKFKGVVAGISSSHHEFLTARGGLIDKEFNILFHSQQCMLHGDCLSPQRKIDDYLYAFSLYSKLGFSIGFLDHPISQRYDYGWGSKDRQVNSHKKIIEFLLKEKIKFVSQEEMFNRLKSKDMLEIENSFKGNKYFIEITNKSKYLLSVTLNNRKYDCNPFSTTSLSIQRGK